MENEVWKDIPHYEGIYEASNMGRIRTCAGKTTFTKKHGIRHWKQRILKPKGETYETGYRVSLWKDGKRKDLLVARLVAMTFLGESNLTVNHIDGNRFNNNIKNLEWCSLKENIQKGFETGLYSSVCKKVKIINKQTNEEIIFRSLQQASLFINKNSKYLSQMILRNIFENKNYKWVVIRKCQCQY